MQQYDGYDPFGFAPSEDEVKIKKKIIRKKRTMASIHQYKALSDVITCAKAKDNATLEGVDKDLHAEGVRPGQVWIQPHGPDIYYLSFIGYHEKGFLMLNLRADERTPLPTASLFKYPRKIKMDLLADIQAKKAKMLTAPTPNLIDKHGEALKDREMDVTLAALIVRPSFWHDHNTNRNYFLSICREGHHRVSIGYLPSGNKCDHFCFNAQHTEAMSFLADIALDKIYYGKSSQHGFYIRHSESTKFATATTAWTYIESVYETYRVIEANKTGAPRNKIAPENIAIDEGDWRVKTSRWLEKNKIRSGQIFPLKIEALPRNSPLSGKEIKARLHKRLCGNLHVELTDSEIFTGEENGSLVKALCEDSGSPFLQLSNTGGIIYLDNKYPFVKCPHCSSGGHIICIKEADLSPTKRKIKGITPIVIENPKAERIAAPGEIVKFEGKPALYLKEIERTEGHLPKIMIMKKNKRITTVHPTQVRQMSQTKENKELFFDENNILKRNFSVETWHKLIVPGSRIKIHPLVQNEKLKHLAGFTVTAVDFPFEADGRPSVGVIESDTIVRLDTDALPCDTFPIEEGMPIELSQRQYKISERVRKEGAIYLQEGDGVVPLIVPEAGLQLAISRGKAKLYEENTVDSILQDL